MFFGSLFVAGKFDPFAEDTGEAEGKSGRGHGSHVGPSATKVGSYNSVMRIR